MLQIQMVVVQNVWAEVAVLVRLQIEMRTLLLSGPRGNVPRASSQSGRQQRGSERGSRRKGTDSQRAARRIVPVCRRSTQEIGFDEPKGVSPRTGTDPDPALSGGY